MAPCPFCNRETDYVLRVGTAAVLWDRFPVNRGHALVIPVAHRVNIFDCTPEEVKDIWEAVLRTKDLLQDKYNPAGFNLGTNIGCCAGQTVFHCHVHVIPRYERDSENPRGGVRQVKRALVDY
jgi:diadenosine tetraphosphate (Ap4A) HIT family hydrolase